MEISGDPTDLIPPFQNISLTILKKVVKIDELNDAMMPYMVSQLFSL